MTASHPTHPLNAYLARIRNQFGALTDGEVASYIPELAKADPKAFGIVLVTTDGEVYQAGDTEQLFTIQSISKAFVYATAMADRGRQAVLRKIHVEPTGDAFNSISLHPVTGAPLNPMINAGAIAAAGLVGGDTAEVQWRRIVGSLSTFAGRTLEIDDAVYRSESETGFRNRAIGWMLRNFGILEEEPTEVLETYFQQCAIEVTCRDLALIGATLANQGRNPLTREQAIAPEYVANILSVMASCGMYDFSGEWLYRVGLPAKSGVGGGILAVLPGQLGIGIFSPPLDAQGNSARGIKVCADLSRDLGLHLFAGGASAPGALRLAYDGSQVSSNRRRPPRQQQTLRASGHRIRVLDLQGELAFPTFEPVVRQALRQAPYCEHMLLDFRNVASVDRVSFRLVAELRDNLAEHDVELVICNAARFAKPMAEAGLPADIQFPDGDTALEHCENVLLRVLEGEHWNATDSVPLSETPLLAGISEADLRWLDERMPACAAAAGDIVIKAGEPGDRLYVLLSGAVEVRVPTEDGGPGRRVQVFFAGMCFGEMGFLDGSPRSADIVAVEPVRYRVLERVLFDSLDNERPRLKIHLLERLAAQLSANLRRSNAEAAAFKG